MKFLNILIFGHINNIGVRVIKNIMLKHRNIQIEYDLRLYPSTAPLKLAGNNISLFIANENPYFHNQKSYRVKIN